ncbi:MAG: hypothetical protein KC588_00920 [Nitrospira sp.]|nr:hypothetical protein [Nitrospira sp.]
MNERTIEHGPSDQGPNYLTLIHETYWESAIHLLKDRPIPTTEVAQGVEAEDPSLVVRAFQTLN